MIVSQDDMKEKLFDQYGFDNMEEKVAIEIRAGNSTMKLWKKILRMGIPLFQITHSV